jgi:hypothetical protein
MSVDAGSAGTGGITTPPCISNVGGPCGGVAARPCACAGGLSCAQGDVNTAPNGAGVCLVP